MLTTTTEDHAVSRSSFLELFMYTYVFDLPSEIRSWTSTNNQTLKILSKKLTMMIIN